MLAKDGDGERLAPLAERGLTALETGEPLGVSPKEYDDLRRASGPHWDKEVWLAANRRSLVDGALGQFGGLEVVVVCGEDEQGPGSAL